MVVTPPQLSPVPPRAAAATTGPEGALPAMSDQATVATVATLVWVAVEDVHPAEDNLRQELGDLSDLASVATMGVLEPLLLTPRGAGGYTIVAGHRRHAAAVAAGLTRVPATVREYTEDERVEVMLVENLQRRNLGPLDEARGYRRLLELGLRQQAIAGRLGISQSHVSKRLALLNLPTEAVDALHSGGITVTDAVELTKLAKHPKRLAEALRQGQEWGDVTEAVRQELDDQRVQEVREASLRTLQDQRVKVVEAPMYGWYDRKEKPLDQLRLDPAEHAKEKCHGAAVMADGRIVEVCRKPENHASPAAIARLERETDAQRAERAKDKARRDAAKAREEHWRGLVGGDDLPHGAVDFVLRELLRDASSRGSSMAARWLGLEPERDQWGTARYDAAIAAYAAQGAEQLRRAAFACGVGQCEEVFRSPWGSGDPQLAHLTGLLEATGYALTQVEIDRVTPRVDDDHPIDELAREALRESGRDLVDDGEEEEDVARCRICGCTEDEPCEGGCEWVEDPVELGELCSRCATQHGIVDDVEEGASS
jgi:ParB/RepB/Spo0J family partition protein